MRRVTQILNVLGRLAAQMDDIANRLARIERRQVALERAVNTTLTIQEIIMSAVDDLVTEVTEISDATTAVETAIDGLLDRIDEVNNDPTVAQAVNDLRSLKTRLVSAALEGTDVAPEPGPVVEPGPVDEPPVS
jgi:ArsR family metal-binding transcriptional regulator